MRQKATLLSVNFLSVMGLWVTFSIGQIWYLVTDHNKTWTSTIEAQLVDVLY